MPEISRFLGIVIAIYLNDHNPTYFHVIYNENRASIDIRTLSVIEGSLPPRVFGLVAEWAGIHQQELMDNWNLLKNTGTFKKIDPLT